MSLLKPIDIEERILYRLRGGERRTTTLLAAIAEEKKVTKQGFYAALRKLEAEESITIYKKNVALNVAWVKELASVAEQVQEVYLPKREETGVLALGEKESVSYIFSNTRHLDTFWGHSQSLIINQTPVTEPVYTYDPHYFFYLARAETEKKLVADIAKSGRQFLMTVGGTDPLDKVIQKDFDSDLRQYHMEEIFPERNRYVVVIGDYITEAHLDPVVARDVDVLYREHETFDEVVRSEFDRLLLIKARHKIKITRNARKARALKVKMGKNFFIEKR